MILRNAGHQAILSLALAQAHGIIHDAVEVKQELDDISSYYRLTRVHVGQTYLMALRQFTSMRQRLGIPFGSFLPDRDDTTARTILDHHDQEFYHA